MSMDRFVPVADLRPQPFYVAVVFVYIRSPLGDSGMSGYLNFMYISPRGEKEKKK